MFLNILKKAATWEIILFNLFPLALVAIGELEFYYFLIYFIVEVLLSGLLSIIKWYHILRTGLFGAFFFMLITLALYAIPLVFILGIAGKYYPDPDISIKIWNIDLILKGLQWFIIAAILKSILHHFHWVRQKQYENTNMKKQFYLTTISGGGGLIVFLTVALKMDHLILNSPIVVAGVFTSIIIVFELWREFYWRKKEI